MILINTVWQVFYIPQNDMSKISRGSLYNRRKRTITFTPRNGSHQIYNTEKLHLSDLLQFFRSEETYNASTNGFSNDRLHIEIEVELFGDSSASMKGTKVSVAKIQPQDIATLNRICNNVDLVEESPT